MLFYVEQGASKEELLKINPLKHKEDIDFLEKKGWIKDLTITPEGKKLLSKISCRDKRKLERYFFGK
jgi:hypothetical protein